MNLFTIASCAELLELTLSVILSSSVMKTATWYIGIINYINTKLNLCLFLKSVLVNDARKHAYIYVIAVTPVIVMNLNMNRYFGLL
jgi:hypothetical protein